jgi:hypothetical protein
MMDFDSRKLSDETLDSQIGLHLKSLPQPPPAIDLAARAIALARLSTSSTAPARQYRAQVAAHARWTQRAQLAASILILLVIYAGGRQIWNVEQQSGTLSSIFPTLSESTANTSKGNSTSDSTESTVDTSSQSSSFLGSFDWSGAEGLMLIGVGLAVGAAVCIAVVRSLGGNDIESNFSPSGVFG